MVISTNLGYLRSLNRFLFCEEKKYIVAKRVFSGIQLIIIPQVKPGH